MLETEFGNIIDRTVDLNYCTIEDGLLEGLPEIKQLGEKGSNLMRILAIERVKWHGSHEEEQGGGKRKDGLV